MDYKEKYKQALRAVEIEREEVIEKACKWLGKSLQGIVGGSVYFVDFKKYMEEQI